MTESTASRSLALALSDEQRMLQEGAAFLDEKCLLLAGEMLRQLGLLATLRAALEAAQARAVQALQAALGRHGLAGLTLLPPPPQDEARGQVQAGALMGVRLQQARWTTDGRPPPPALADSPEARDLREAFTALVEAAAPLAAVQGNLERLSQEYRRSVRRARALQDVLLPELAHGIADIATRIEELEQQDAITMRHGALHR